MLLTPLLALALAAPEESTVTLTRSATGLRFEMVLVLGAGDAEAWLQTLGSSSAARRVLVTLGAGPSRMVRKLDLTTAED